MGTSLVNFRLDDEVKRQMESVCAEIGISMSAAFNIYARSVARNGRIPFDVSATTLPYPPAHLIIDPASDASLTAALAPAFADVEAKRTLTADEARDYLREHGLSTSEDSSAGAL